MSDKIELASAAVTLEGDGMTYWDKVALSRWGDYLTSIERRMVAQAIELAGAPGSGIDMGCGSGRWSKLAADKGWRMTCVDVDRESLAICQRNIPKAVCLLGNPADNTIPCPTQSAGLLLCIEVAPVFDADWFPSEAARVLGDGGILVAVAWNRSSWRGLACCLKQRLVGRPCPIRFYKRSYADSKNLLTDAGFQMLYEEGLCWGPAGRTSNSVLVPLYVKLERLLQLNRRVAGSPWVVFIARKEEVSQISIQGKLRRKMLSHI